MQFMQTYQRNKTRLPTQTRDDSNMTLRILGIESSCDETGAAIYQEGRGMISNALFSQIELHKK